MDVDEIKGLEADHPGRWSHVQKLLECLGPFSHENFYPLSKLFDTIRNIVQILVIGCTEMRGGQFLDTLCCINFKWLL